MLQAMLGTARGTRSEGVVIDQDLARPFGGFHSFTALPSNIGAIEASMKFVSGASPFVALSGPSGWGKSHLLLSVEELMAKQAPNSVTLVSALQWCGASGRQDFAGTLILDDVQDVASHPRARHTLRQALDHRVRTGRRTLLAWMTSDSAKRTRALLPAGRDWLIAPIVEPTIDERELVVLQIANELQVTLSRATAQLVARHLNGNGRSIRGAIQRLRLVKTDWSTDQDVIPACGVLSPYLLGHNGWDPRDHVHEAVTKVFSESASSLSRNDVSCYLMMHEMGLSETEVATFLKVSPSKAYGHCVKVKSQLSEGLGLTLVDACRNTVLSGFEGG